ncbi:MAG: hypothetical protein GY927_16195 [bacterium]|nr:hypothetical protein [bacterium]
MRKFSEIQTIRQTFLWFHNENIEVPVTKDIGGRKQLVWQLPTKPYIGELVRNPLYAGVYTWGRETVKMDYVAGRVVKRRVKYRGAKAAKVFIEENHEAYIDLSTFYANQAMIENNCLSQCDSKNQGAARDGEALLSGLLRCGRCGRKLYVMYRGKSGTGSRYICRGDYESGGRYCLAFGGRSVDKAFSKELLQVISPYGLDASLGAMTSHSRISEDKRSLIKDKICQLDYESARAFEQYNEVDPRNRLVASELESRWNEKLKQLIDAKQELEKLENDSSDELSDSEREEILYLGEYFSDVWSSSSCPNSLRKKIIRTVVNEVVVNWDDETDILRFVIHWKGGCHTELTMIKPPSGVGQKTEKDDLEIIRKMAAGYCDADIARVLNKLGRRTATGKRWSHFRVQTIRGKYKIPGHLQPPKNPEILTLGQSAKYLQVSQTSIKRLVATGVLAMTQVVPWAPWEIKKSDLDSSKITEIIKRLRETGKLLVNGVHSEKQGLLFSES